MPDDNQQPTTSTQRDTVLFKLLALQALFEYPKTQRQAGVSPLLRAHLRAVSFIPLDVTFPTVTSMGGSILIGQFDLATVHRFVSDKFRAWVKQFIRYNEQAYKTDWGTWEIGWAHAGVSDVNDGTVYSGQQVSESRAAFLLDYDIEKAEAVISANCQPFLDKLDSFQFDALVSFQLQTRAFPRSRVLLLLREGRFDDAADEITGYRPTESIDRRGRNWSRRRLSESKLFHGEDYPVVPLADVP